MRDLLTDLAKHGQLRVAEGRGLDEALEGESLGPNRDKECYRDGFAPNESGQKLIADAILKIDQLTQHNFLQKLPVNLASCNDLLEILKGTLIIIYPQGLTDETLKEAINQADDYSNGLYNDEGFINIESGALFFANKALTQRGEAMKSLNVLENSTLKCIPSKSQTYAPRSHQDQNQAEMMRFLYMKEQSKKKAEIMTEDDVYQRDWADGNSLKKQLQGMGDVRFK